MEAQLTIRILFEKNASFPAMTKDAIYPAKYEKDL
jgi:hypothetical protein